MKRVIKKLSCIAAVFLILLFAVACADGENRSPSGYERPADPVIDTSFEPESHLLVAYFSKTNNTAAVADIIAEYTAADRFEIRRKEPYPEAYTPTTEEAQAEKDANARPELAAYLPDDVVSRYDTVFLGFPIWWHTAPMPVLSFLNYYDFSGKTVVTFCTAASSPISESTADIRDNTEATVIEGRKFGRNDGEAIRLWLDGLDLDVG